VEQPVRRPAPLVPRPVVPPVVPRPAAPPLVLPPPAPGPWLAGAAGSLAAFGLLLVAVVVTHGADPLDAAVLRATPALRRPSLTAAAHLVTVLGAFPVVVAVAVLGAALLWRRTGDPLAPAVLLTTVVVTAAVVYLTKVAVGRARPAAGSLLGTPSTDFSFPSGHTTDGSLVFLLTALLLAPTLRSAAGRRLVLVGAVLVGLAVGATRVYLGYHWATDVLAGWLLATGLALAATLLARLLAGPDEPALLPGGRADRW